MLSSSGYSTLSGKTQVERHEMSFCVWFLYDACRTLSLMSMLSRRKVSCNGAVDYANTIDYTGQMLTLYFMFLNRPPTISNE